MFDFIYKGLGYVMRFCYYDIGFESYALALIWFALFTKIVLIPFTIKQQKNQIKGAKLRPKMMAIEKKYAGRTDRPTLQKKQQEIMEMQQKEGYSPLSGCLPMILQLAFVIILYNIIREPLSYICMLPKDNVSLLVNALQSHGLGDWSNDQIGMLGVLKSLELSAYPEIQEILSTVDLPNFSLFGNFIDLSKAPAFWTWSLLIPVFTFSSQFFSMKLTRWLNPMMQMQAESNPEMATSNKIMDLMMPAMTLFFAFSLPSALGFYWIIQSVIAIIQMLLLAKFMPMPTFTPEELKAAERALKGKPVKSSATAGGSSYTPSANRPRSLHHIDDEDEAPVQAPKKNNGSKPAAKPQPKKAAGIEAAPLKEDDRPEKAEAAPIEEVEVPEKTPIEEAVAEPKVEETATEPKVKEMSAEKEATAPETTTPEN